MPAILWLSQIPILKFVDGEPVVQKFHGKLRHIKNVKTKEQNLRLFKNK